MQQVDNTKISSDVDILFQDYADVVTVPELAKMLRIGRNSAYDLVNDSHIQSVKVGSQIRIPKTSIIEFLKTDKKIGEI
jgi:excisionase family DNA binding protein